MKLMCVLLLAPLIILLTLLIGAKAATFHVKPVLISILMDVLLVSRQIKGRSTLLSVNACKNMLKSEP